MTIHDTAQNVKPVVHGVLHQEDYERRLHDPLEDVIAYQDRCFPDELTAIERTADPWFCERPGW